MENVNEQAIKDQIRQNKIVYGISYKRCANLVDIQEREFYNWLNNNKKLPLIKLAEIDKKLQEIKNQF